VAEIPLPQTFRGNGIAQRRLRQRKGLFHNQTIFFK
jgi:hypothetical protein